MMDEPERIKLGPEAVAILKRRCGEAEHAAPRTYFCPTCADEGIVYSRVTTGRYPYFAAWRCHCDGKERGFFVTKEDRERGSHQRTFGNRTWDTQIRRYSDGGITRDQVYSLHQRLAYEEQERMFREAASTPEAIEERKAIQGEHGEVVT